MRSSAWIHCVLTSAVVLGACSESNKGPAPVGVAGTAGQPPGGTGGRSRPSGSGGTGGFQGGTGGGAPAPVTGGVSGSGGVGGVTGSGDGGSGGRVGSGGSAGDATAGEVGGGGMTRAVKCGEMTTPVVSTGAAEGVVITPDGTLYYSQSFNGSNIGRYRPGMAAEPSFVPNVGAQVLGLTYDPKRKLLYAGRRSNPPAVLKINVAVTPPTVSVLAPAETGINGVTLGEDDAVYYSDQNDRRIFRVTPEGMKQQVNTTPLPGQPNGLAFGADKALYVVYWSGSMQVTKLTLTDGVETGRAVFIQSIGAGNADGAAFDEMGRLYVTANGMLRRIAADGSSVDMMMASNGANIDFGAGSLKCTDVYVGSNDKGIRRHTLDVKGANVPWHREAP